MVAITRQSVADEIRRQQKLSSSILDLQTQISSGKKITQASDSPQDWVQISEIGRAQAQQVTWKSNLSYAETRASTADSNMEEISSLLTRAQELMTSAGSTLNDSNRTAISAELQSIQKTISSILTQKDALGTPVFDQGTATLIPVGGNQAIEAVPMMESLSQNINVNGVSMSLDDIFSDAISAMNSGDESARQSALTAFQAAGDHIDLSRTLQGHRQDRIERFSTKLADAQVALEEQRSALQDTNLSEAVATLQSTSLSLEAAQATYAKISQRSLFDLIS